MATYKLVNARHSTALQVLWQMKLAEEQKSLVYNRSVKTIV
jgi:hypothetical protein